MNLIPDPHWLRLSIRDADLIDVLSLLTDLQKTILLELVGEYGIGPRHAADYLRYYESPWRMSPEKLRIDMGRKALQDLERLGCLYFGFLMSEYQGELMGKGYWISEFGERVRFQIENGYFDAPKVAPGT